MRKIDLTKLLRAAPLAAIIAAAVNAAIYLMGKATGKIPDDILIPNANQPLTLVPILVASVLPCLVAGVVMAMIARLTENPFKVFGILTLVILLLSVYTPFAIPNAPMAMIVMLLLMHVVVAGTIFVIFRTMTLSDKV
jgi:hypothetical protein